MKKWMRIGILFIVVLIVIFLFKEPILKSIGSFLIQEDNFEFIENAFVLSGGAYDRGNKAIELYKEKKINKIICVGGNVTPNLKALGIEMLESELTNNHILSGGVDTNDVSILPNGTSTLEESEAILRVCKSKKLQSIVVISSKFHTRRISNVFMAKFEENGIQVFISGAPSSSYSEYEWWQSENGMIALNNEYVKLLYYFIK